MASDDHLYLSEDEWRKNFIRMPNAPVKDIISSLGLKAEPIRNTTRVRVKHYPELYSSITEVTKPLQDFSLDTLVAMAADKRSLEVELDNLLQQFGHLVWGREADRTKLEEAHPSKSYSKALIYEIEADRLLIRSLLHKLAFTKLAYRWWNYNGKSHGMLGRINTNRIAGQQHLPIETHNVEEASSGQRRQALPVLHPPAKSARTQPNNERRVQRSRSEPVANRNRGTNVTENNMRLGGNNLHSTITLNSGNPPPARHFR